MHASGPNREVKHFRLLALYEIISCEKKGRRVLFQAKTITTGRRKP